MVCDDALWKYKFDQHFGGPKQPKTFTWREMVLKINDRFNLIKHNHIRLRVAIEEQLEVLVASIVTRMPRLVTAPPSPDCIPLYDAAEVGNMYVSCINGTGGILRMGRRVH